MTEHIAGSRITVTLVPQPDEVLNLPGVVVREGVDHLVVAALNFEGALQFGHFGPDDITDQQASASGLEHDRIQRLLRVARIKQGSIDAALADAYEHGEVIGA